MQNFCERITCLLPTSTRNDATVIWLMQHLLTDAISTITTGSWKSKIDKFVMHHSWQNLHNSVIVKCFNFQYDCLLYQHKYLYFISFSLGKFLKTWRFKTAASVESSFHVHFPYKMLHIFHCWQCTKITSHTKCYTYSTVDNALTLYTHKIGW